MDLDIGAISPGKKPALIMVDLSLGFTSPDSPLGGDYSDVVAVNKQLIDWFRARELPIFFTSVIYDNDDQASVFRTRLPDLNILKRGSDWVNIDPRLEPREDDVIIEKHGPSGFFARTIWRPRNRHSVNMKRISLRWKPPSPCTTKY